MFLHEVLPTMDQGEGSLHPFDCSLKNPATSSELLVFVRVMDVFLEINICIGEEIVHPDYSDRKKISCCNAIKAITARKGFDRIFKGTVETFMYEEQLILCGNLKIDRKVVVAVKRDGSGLIEIADNDNYFAADLPVSELPQATGSVH